MIQNKQRRIQRDVNSLCWISRTWCNVCASDAELRKGAVHYSDGRTCPVSMSSSVAEPTLVVSCVPNKGSSQFPCESRDAPVQEIEYETTAAWHPHQQIEEPQNPQRKHIHQYDNPENNSQMQKTLQCAQTPTELNNLSTTDMFLGTWLTFASFSKRCVKGLPQREHTTQPSATICTHTHTHTGIIVTYSDLSRLCKLEHLKL